MFLFGKKKTKSAQEIRIAKIKKSNKEKLNTKKQQKEYRKRYDKDKFIADIKKQSEAKQKKKLIF